nr:Domain of uncharacterised function (DUF1889) [Klebsiella pneumoniae]
MAEWAERVAAGERLVIKHPEFFSTYMREELRAGVIAAHPPRLFSLMPSPIGKAFCYCPR